MPSPIFIFGFVVSTLMAATLHLVVGGEARRLALLFISSWVGFLTGQLAAESFNITLFDMGQLHLVPAIVSALLGLFITIVLTSGRRNQAA